MPPKGGLLVKTDWKDYYKLDFNEDSRKIIKNLSENCKNLIVLDLGFFWDV